MPAGCGLAVKEFFGFQPACPVHGPEQTRLYEITTKRRVSALGQVS